MNACSARSPHNRPATKPLGMTNFTVRAYRSGSCRRIRRIRAAWEWITCPPLWRTHTSSACSRMSAASGAQRLSSQESSGPTGSKAAPIPIIPLICPSMPMATTAGRVSPAFSTASRTERITESKMAAGSSVTEPSAPRSSAEGTKALPRTCPAASVSTVLVPCVPMSVPRKRGVLMCFTCRYSIMMTFFSPIPCLVRRIPSAMSLRGSRAVTSGWASRTPEEMNRRVLRYWVRLARVVPETISCL